MNLPVVLIVLAISFFWIYRRVFYRPFSHVLYAHLHIPRLMRQMFKRGSISRKLNRHLWDSGHLGIHYSNSLELNNAFHDWAFCPAGIISSSIQTHFSAGQFPSMDASKYVVFNSYSHHHQCFDFDVLIDWLWAENDRILCVFDAQLYGPTFAFATTSVQLVFPLKLSMPYTSEAWLVYCFVAINLIYGNFVNLSWINPDWFTFELVLFSVVWPTWFGLNNYDQLFSTALSSFLIRAIVPTAIAGYFAVYHNLYTEMLVALFGICGCIMSEALALMALTTSQRAMIRPLPEDIIISILSFATRRELNAIQESNSTLNLLISSYFSSSPLAMINVYLVYYEAKLFLTREKKLIRYHKQPKDVNGRSFCTFFNHPDYKTLVRAKYLRIEGFIIWVDQAILPKGRDSLVIKNLTALSHLWASRHLAIYYTNSLELNNAFHDWAFGQSGIFSSSTQTTFSDGQFPTTGLMLSSQTTKIASFHCPYLPHQCLNFDVMIDWLWAKNDRCIFVWDAQLYGPTSIYSIFDRVADRFLSSTTRSNFKFWISLFGSDNMDILQQLYSDDAIIGPVFNHTTEEKLIGYPTHTEGTRSYIKTLAIRRLGMREQLQHKRKWYFGRIYE
ncbi:hypothetical protein DdX_18933 [Ditylenchus destructor]|uniref:Uncharacterized protein n=1 Tax=Ditylenchus destructor TaxID=166010 RepID=A0AAD4MJC3_9BILA|nr:hypothetical protein DdX_18933 [Ditylenchus destructor]